MAYALTVKVPTGKTGLYSVIQDYETQKYWDEVANAWVTEITSDCNVALTEGTGADKGTYTGSAADLDPVPGGVYQIAIYDSNDAEYLVTTIETYRSKTQTLLQVVNHVQRGLRMPVSSGVSDSLSVLIIQKINDVARLLLPSYGIFDETKVRGSFVVTTGKDVYRIPPVNMPGVDKVISLRNPNNTYLIELTDEKFRIEKDSYNQSLVYSQPVYYRVASMDDGYPIIELCPQPDAAYMIAYEMVSSRPTYSSATEYVSLPELVKLASLMLCKQDFGMDTTTEQMMLQSAISLFTSSRANHSIQDVEV